MADIATTTFGIGDPVPPFSLPDTDGVAHAVPQDPAPPATVIAVTCNHCPHVIAWNPHLRRVAEEYGERGVRFLAVNANDSSRYPADSLEAMQRFVRDQQWPIPYLHDEAQDVARALGAEVTPHIFVLDGEHRLVYRGAPGSDARERRVAARRARRRARGRGAGARPRPARAGARSSGAPEPVDAGAPASFTFEDMLRYHGPGSPGGVAHAYKVLERALPLLAPDAPAERREIVVRTAFGGPARATASSSSRAR